MIYIRNIFQQDLRDGKQIAFPKEVSNQFFNFYYQNNDPARRISFIFKDGNSLSPFFSLNNSNVSTRLYAAGTESRIDGELKRFLIDNLHADINDKILFRKINDNKYDFEFIPQTSEKHKFILDLLGTKNHEVLLNPSDESAEDEILTIDIVNNFAKWLNANPKSNYYENDFDKTVKGLEKIDEKYIEAFGNSVFDVDFDNLEEFTESVNNNIWNKESSFWAYSDATSTHLPRAILNENNYQRFLREYQQKKNKNSQPKNTIYYGAPGTGKSYKVDQIIKDLDPKFYQRVTFHPEFDNASFVGGYKPFSEKNTKGEDVINYKFVPQAFASIYSDAWKDLDNDYYLVIEEINRGNCAEIFGEIFQLLDRNSNYTVTPSKELNDHLIEKFDNNKEHEGIAKGLKLPSNLHILATMNTSDQSLFPMDSAFKRRWEWEYVPICYDAQNEEGKSNESFNFEIDLGDGSKYRWIDFIAKINNNHIKNNQALGMDKCIGNYFVKPDDANNITLKPFINKVIFYLWNDVFKDEDNKVFESNSSYEDFFPIFTNGLTKVKELFERIELAPISGYPSREEEQELGQVAEGNQPLAE